MTGPSRPDQPLADAADRDVVRHETYGVATARRVAAMLDRDPDPFTEGKRIPRGWHFPLLGADTRRSALRPDGFPGLGVPLPDLGLPRLMIVGRTMQFGGDIEIGRALRRTSRVERLSRKDGASGPMALVTIAHEIAASETAAPLLTETQTYILLGARPPARAVDDGDAVPLPSLTKRVVPDDTLLFQYSALGFNSHRIHIDRAFATQTEGFPDLVVNGGLTTLLLTEFFAEAVGRPLTALSARYTAPLVCGRPITLGIEPGETGWHLRAFDDAGRIAVDIQANSA